MFILLFPPQNLAKRDLFINFHYIIEIINVKSNYDILSNCFKVIYDKIIEKISS